MKTCGSCIHWKHEEEISNIGDCQLPLPIIITKNIDSYEIQDFRRTKSKNLAIFCVYYKEKESHINEKTI